MAKRAKTSEPSDSSEPDGAMGIVKVDEPVVDPPPEVNTNREPPVAPPALPPGPLPTPTGPSFGERVGRFFRFLLRVVSLLILLSLLSVALYLVLPWLYQKFIQPVEQNTIQVRELQSQQERMKQELADLQTKLGTIETVQNQHDGSINQSDERLGAIETEIASRTQSLTALETMQSELQAKDEVNSAELERQIDLLKSMELLSRARLSLYQSNFGLAKSDIQIARDLLAAIQPTARGPLATELEAVIQRLDLTLSNLPDFPVAASDDLDIAWQILLSGLPPATPTLSATPSPAGTITVTLTNALTPTVTPTLKVTISPTATP
jgi:hypothetical protein